MKNAHLEDAIRQVVQALEALNLPYALGGAVAMGLLGYPRATRDLDILILLPALRTQEFADAVSGAGFMMRDDAERPIPIDARRIIESSRAFGQFRIWLGDVKVEIFVPKVPLQDSILKRRLRVRIGDLEVWITAAEDLVLLKMVFHRDKDLVDVRRLLAANRDTLDVRYLRRWAGKTLPDAVGQELEAMMGAAGLDL